MEQPACCVELSRPRSTTRGRLKIPTQFRAAIEDRYGTQLFITSLTGALVLIYPMRSGWRSSASSPRFPPRFPPAPKYFDRVNYFGKPGEFDKQGRVSIQARLRDAATMVGEVDVFGQYDHLDVWNHEHFTKRLADDPFTDDDARALAEYGI